MRGLYSKLILHAIDTVRGGGIIIRTDGHIIDDKITRAAIAWCRDTQSDDAMSAQTACDCIGLDQAALIRTVRRQCDKRRTIKRGIRAAVAATGRTAEYTIHEPIAAKVRMLENGREIDYPRWVRSIMAREERDRIATNQRMARARSRTRAAECCAEQADAA